VIKLCDEIMINMSRLGIKKPLLVTTGKSFDKYFKNHVANISYVRFSDYTPNPKIEDVKKGTELLKSSQCDGLISLGGGSAMDIAKMISIDCLNPGLNFKEKLTLETYQTLPHIAVPTTAGSGSEATQFAVVYIEKKKYSLDHKVLMPNKSILEPSLLEFLPAQQIACPGLDALCQAIESHWSRRSTENSREYSSKAISLVWSSLASAYNKDSQAMQKVQSGAHYAGRAINITRTTAPHAVSYPFTSRLGFAHGHAVSLSLLYFMKINLSSTHGKNEAQSFEETQQRISEIFELTDSINFADFSVKFKKLCEVINVPLTGFSLSSTDKQYILGQINIQRLANNPVKIETYQIVEFLDRL